MEYKKITQSTFKKANSNTYCVTVTQTCNYSFLILCIVNTVKSLKTT
jgi:hypothetical protein